MKVLIIGGGGREHALAWRLSRSPAVREIIASPGNPGIAELGGCIPAPANVAGYVEIAAAHAVDLTIVGPEAPLVAGVVDAFHRARKKIIGPTQAAARLEGSKSFAKQLMQRAGVPTAQWAPATSHFEALLLTKRFRFPQVIKADGLAGGKGVTIASNRMQAEAAIAQLGPNLIIEEFLEGEEVSFIALSNGEMVIPFAPTQDHKRVLDGDRGPNTGGMGAYRDPRILSARECGDITERIMLPVLAQMRKEGHPFTGFLYAGLMMTAQGPKVLEFNVRLGDPETQALMHSFHGDFAEVLAMTESGPETLYPGSWKNCSVCVVLAAQGYPEKPRAGDVITGIAGAEATGASVFHAGTRKSGNDVVTNGGRVLGVTASAETLPDAIERAYKAVEKIRFDGMHYRRDIGQKGLKRW